MEKISTCLWFDSQAEAAARFYTGVFKNSSIGKIERYGKAGQEYHRQAEGSVMTVDFELDGRSFTALNGGPVFTFNEAVSLVITCETQDEVDYYWDRLSDGGDPAAQVCGWLKDKYGLSWQVVPSIIPRLSADPDRAKVERMLTAMYTMKKLNIAELQKAFDG
ncbi:VOC family protein [Breznakiella homolactica]|uniref:VOC family protein n=1 Tax=Breznakiella homolactica TaxID=2798577 RepID=A0A7T8BA04_9SPIR|nr:VOC family protein [Breznakiella homolactica]QQO08856.1 VOC family protein [Breznakiella homolactica]